jgi:hypothetical protein
MKHKKSNIGKKMVGLVATGAGIGVLGAIGSNIPNVGGTLASSATGSMIPAINISGMALGSEIGFESMKKVTKHLKGLKL